MQNYQHQERDAWLQYNSLLSPSYFPNSLAEVRDFFKSLSTITKVDLLAGSVLCLVDI